jgi:hypothetical protein
MKKLIAVAAAFWTAPALAQTTPPTPAVEVSGTITPGVQQVDNTTNSSKLTEYRDLRDNFYLPNVAFVANDVSTGWVFDLTGTNVSRHDQAILANAARPGIWDFRANWVEIPHNFSNKAVTPFIRKGPSLFEVPATVPITFKTLATAAADTAGVLASDALVAAYQSRFLAPTPLATQTNNGHFALAWSGSDAASFGVAYDRRDKSGLKSAFGPIGDRPPRSLNIQFTEPVDYHTNDLTFSAEHEGAGYQVRAEYLFSDFANQIDTLQWQNIYTTAAPGASFDVWDRLVATSGVRPLPPDNRYHSVTVNGGVGMPRDSRLIGSVTYGRLQQDQTLLPYTFQADTLANRSLPRSTAQGLMNSVNVAADYVVAPASGVNIRAFFREYALHNDTPSSRWQYVTSDTTNLNGSVAYVNKRVSVPYAWDRLNAGAEATWRLPRRHSVTVGYEREGIDREFREANTSENVVRTTWRLRAAPGVSFLGRYIYGLRDGGTYHNQVTQEGYWYALSEANDANNPQLTFDNHPDMRRFDVSDRRRHQIDLTVNLTPRDVAAVSAFVRYRNDSFDSNVTPSQPLLGTGLPEQTATSAGDQLGVLEDKRLRFGTDVFVQPVPRASFNAFLNFDRGASFERSMEFNENNKQNPSAVANAVLGPWTRASSQWTADFEDRTWSGGGGATLQIVPDRLAVIADYTLSLANVDIAYTGYGLTSFDGTPFPPDNEFAFSSPPAVRENLHVVNLRFEIPISGAVLIAGYSFEHYTLDDWQQGSTAPWVEAVGAETLLRDTSRSFQWGNRLFNLGTYLAPTYNAHIGFVGFRYRF